MNQCNQKVRYSAAALLSDTLKGQCYSNFVFDQRRTIRIINSENDLNVMNTAEQSKKHVFYKNGEPKLAGREPQVYLQI